MPMVKPAASKYLAQKWEAEHFRVHRMRVKNAPSLLDMKSPKQYPHLKLGLNRIAIQEEKQNRYDKENQMLLNKIRVIVKGHGTVNNWNQWSRRDLHAAARMKQQRDIEIANQNMLKRLQNTKPVIQRMKQKNDFEKHRAIQGMLDGTTKDYPSPRTRNNSDNGSIAQDERKSVNSRLESSADKQNSPRDESSKADTENNAALPPLPPGQKEKKINKPPPENRKKNRTADVPKLPAI